MKRKEDKSPGEAIKKKQKSTTKDSNTVTKTKQEMKQKKMAALESSKLMAARLIEKTSYEHEPNSHTAINTTSLQQSNVISTPKVSLSIQKSLTTSPKTSPSTNLDHLSASPYINAVPHQLPVSSSGFFPNINVQSSSCDSICQQNNSLSAPDTNQIGNPYAHQPLQTSTCSNSFYDWGYEGSASEYLANNLTTTEYTNKPTTYLPCKCETVIQSLTQRITILEEQIQNIIAKQNHTPIITKPSLATENLQATCTLSTQPTLSQDCALSSQIDAPKADQVSTFLLIITL